MASKIKFSDQLRQAVRTCGMSRYAISKTTGIPESNLSRFVNQGAGLSLDSLDLLAEALGLRIVAAKKTKSKGN